MAAVRPDMRIQHGRSIQAEVAKFGEAFLDSSKTKGVKKSVVTIQSWIKNNFSPLVLCFFLSDRDENEEGAVGGITSAAHAGTALTEDEKKVQLRCTLHDLLDKYVIPSVRRAIESCQDQAVLSQTLVKSLANVRKDWNAFLTTAKFMLISLESESGKSGSNQVEQIFRRAFQETVFKEFRTRLVQSLHDLVGAVRTDPNKLQQVCSDAQELIKQFFDDLNANAATAATSGNIVPVSGAAGAAANASEWAHSETKKLEDFHNVFIEPYKKKMSEQLLELARQYEMQNDLPGLLAWIPLARKREMELIKGMFGNNVYPADFESLSNNILYEFDKNVAAENALRLIEHNQFGVDHILKTLPLENPNTQWEAKQLAPDASTSAADDTNVLLNRLKDLYVVAATAQRATALPLVLRTLPRTVTRNQRAAERRRDQANESKVEDVQAFSKFKSAIKEHGAKGFAAIVDSLRSGRDFKSEKEYASELCAQLSVLLKKKSDIVINLCENSPDVERAYSEAFRHCINDQKASPTFTRLSRNGPEPNRPARYPDIVSHYIDVFLNSKETDIDTKADAAVEILSYIVDKDIFIEVYRIAIAKRFLAAKEYTDQQRDREDTVLSRLKKQLTATAVRKCGQGMMDDLTHSKSLKDQFELSNLSQFLRDGGIEFNPRILGSMNWPQSKALEGKIIWCEALTSCLGFFEKWYLSKNPTRQLKWQHERGHCVLEINYPKGKKEISFNLVQANFLIHLDTTAPVKAEYSSKGGCTLNELHGITGFNVDDLDVIAASMVGHGPNPALLKISGPGAATKKLDPSTDRLALNPEFVFKLKKFACPAVPSKKGHAEDDDKISEKEIDKWRLQQAEAAIVRIMKSSHTMGHEDLIRRTIEHLEKSFLAQPTFLKKAIQELISKEYLERDENDHSCYRYRA